MSPPDTNVAHYPRWMKLAPVAFFDIHHYIYDLKGTRLMKASLKHDYTAEDGQQLGAT
jgi:hypothetical protein